METPDKNKWLDDALVKTIGSQKREPDFAKWQQEHRDAVEALTAGSKNMRGRINIAKIILHSRIAKLAAAAVIVIAAFIAMNRYGRPIDGASPAWADVIEQIRKARSVTYKETFECDVETPIPPLVTELAMNEQGITRTVYPGGNNIIIDDWCRGLQLQIEPQQKKATLYRSVGRPRKFGLFNRFDWLISGQIKHCKLVGQEKIKGKVTNVFSDEDNVNMRTTTIWVDLQTDLPVQVKLARLPNPDPNMKIPNISLSDADFGGEGGRGGSVGGISKKSTTIMSDFVWNAELDESLFNTSPPEGFSVEERQINASQASEQDLIETLAFWTEMSDGLFPSTINDLADANKIKAMLIKKFNGDGDPNDEKYSALEKAGTIIDGLIFARTQRNKGSWYYAGNGVKLGDSEKPICWWKKEGSDRFRVIYGNLSIGDVDANELPKIP